VCGSMVDIQPATAENIVEEKRKKNKKEETTGLKYNVRICYVIKICVAQKKRSGHEVPGVSSAGRKRVYGGKDL